MESLQTGVIKLIVKSNRVKSDSHKFTYQLVDCLAEKIWYEIILDNWCIVVIDLVRTTILSA